MNKNSNWSQGKAPVTEDLELVLEAARRANWDAQRGPAHLRSGRFFVSELHRLTRRRRRQLTLRRQTHASIPIPPAEANKTLDVNTLPRQLTEQLEQATR